MFVALLLLIFLVLIATFSNWNRIRKKELKISLKKAVLITGCDSGIGLQLAKYFYEQGLTTICGYIDIESDGYKELNVLSANCDDNTHRRLELIKLDVTSKQDIANTVEFLSREIESNKFELHALINNAGVCIYGEFDWLTSGQIHNLFSINLIGSINLTKALIKFLIQSKGRLVNVSSVNDSTVFPGLSIYSATKVALSTFSKGLSYEVRKFGMKVVTVRLGDFARLTNIMSRHEHHKNEMWAAMREDKRSIYRDFFDKFNGHILKNYGMTSPKEFSHSNLFQDFRSAVLSIDPPYVITCSPMKFKLFYWLIERLPIGLQHSVLDLMLNIAFGWKGPAINCPSLKAD